MYSAKVVEKNQEKLEAKTGLKLVRFSVNESLAWVDHLSRLYDEDNEQMKRPLKQDEKEFIRNERLLCSIDFHYWCRYAQILRDPEVGGGMGYFEPWGAQTVILSLIAKLEEEMVEAYARGESVDGILLAIHKARQLGATMLVRCLHLHRLTTSYHTRAIGASVDEDKVFKIYERDKRIYDNLPWWMRPKIAFEEKAKHLSFEGLDSSLLYQELVQRSGIAQGDQFDLGHITEAASDPFGGVGLQHDYTPTIPRSPYSLHIMETTPQGRNNWWRFFVDDLRKGGTRWRLCYVPWYAEPKKYRKTPPVDWQPSDEAMLHAQTVYDTSEEYVGNRVMLPKENLYWWEFTRNDYVRKGRLNLFLTNWSATIDESFQHTTESVFDAALLDHYRSHSAKPQVYEIAS